MQETMEKPISNVRLKLNKKLFSIKSKALIFKQKVN